jgi:hypothetical protein
MLNYYNLIGATIIPITKLSLNKTNSMNDTGTTYKLVCTITPSNATVNTDIIWESSNKTVLEVNSSGNVSFKKAGSANVTAKSKYDNSIQAICRFTVTNPSSPDPSDPSDPIYATTTTTITSGGGGGTGTSSVKPVDYNKYVIMCDGQRSGGLGSLTLTGKYVGSGAFKYYLNCNIAGNKATGVKSATALHSGQAIVVDSGFGINVSQYTNQMQLSITWSDGVTLIYDIVCWQ